MMLKKRIGTVLIACILAVGSCFAFGGCSKKIKLEANTADAVRTFNYWIPKTDGTGVGGDYEKYEQNPSIIYQTGKDWTYKTSTKSGSTYTQGSEVTNRVALNFEAPTTGQEQNSFLTNLKSGKMDVMEMSFSPDTVTEMYENGKALDITYYVENYMPNYKKYVTDNGLEKYVTNEVDGERKYLQLYSYTDAVDDLFLGYQYRRDWILKYGTDPSTGSTTGQTFAAAHSDWGWTTQDGNKVWVDDIKFPSYYGYQYATASNGSTAGMGTLSLNQELKTYMDGEYKTFVKENPEGYIYEEYKGQWPVTISDWEWMLDIIQIALNDLGYSKKGYCTSLYMPGFNFAGNLVSSFGGGGVEWYRNGNDVEYGADTATMKTYMEAMSGWYSNGWIDTEFQSHTDLFYRWDEAKVWQGYVGLWCGHVSNLMDSMDQSGGSSQIPTNGICAYGMPLPINDKYGENAQKYKKPYVFYTMSAEVNSTIVTTDAEKNGKDLAALFTFLDYQYTEEASAIKAAGLTKEMLEDCPEAVRQFFAKYGCEDGSMYIAEDGNYYMTDAYAKLSTTLQMAIKSNRISGKEAYVPVYGDRFDYLFRKQLWNMYDATGYLTPSFYNQLTPAQYTIYNTNITSLRNNFSAGAPAFIKGNKSMSEWDSYISGLKSSCNVNNITTMLNNLLDKLEPSVA